MNTTIQETLTRLKEFDLFIMFKYAMEQIVKETSQPQQWWWESNLSKYGLAYHHHEFTAIWQAMEKGIYDDFLDDLTDFDVKPATSNLKYSRSYFRSKNVVYYIMGLDFGCIKWNPRSYLDEYYPAKIEFVANKISYECFFGMTPKQILESINNFS